MPTPNDFSNVQFTPQQDDYGQSSREQRDRSILTKDNEPPLPGPSAGNYPRTFDGGMPSDNYQGQYGNYPDTETRVMVPGSNPGSGEFGQVIPGNYGPYPGTNMVPSPTPSKQFSSDKTGDPKALLEQTRASVNLHSDLVDTYGYHMPVATLGSHPWLRDGLADASTKEPGNAEPKKGLKIPFRLEGQ